MATTQNFDFDKAAALRTQLKNKIEVIDQSLDDIQNTVNGVREWWTGGSEEGFIKNFTKTKEKIRKGLQEWLKDYENLMKEVEKEKAKADDELKKALS